MSLHRLIGFRTAVPDPAALAAYFQELGLGGSDTAGWAGSNGGATVQVDESDVRRLLSIDIGCTDEADVGRVRARLEANGARTRHDDESVTVVDSASRVTITVRVAEREPVATSVVTPPTANVPGAMHRVNERSPAVFAPARPPRRLGHLVVGTPDLAATRDLLVDGIGCKVSDEVDGIIHFLRCSTDHHNIALVHSPVPLLQHYSWECDDVDHVGVTATALYRADPGRHVWGLGRHFAGSNFYWYLRDPSGSFIELYADLDRIDDDDAWQRGRREPMDFDRIANAWGPNLPTEFIVPDDLPELEAAWARVDR